MLEFGHLTHPGMRRELNADTYYGDTELALWLVADGMGGHACGEVASHPHRRRRNHPRLAAAQRHPADGYHRRCRARAGQPL
ncbi:hypothetical protein G6F51_014423 [Rhizopus arrhizus]|uniref:PPM-type phosphatase domain-containing protein n=1 Tax=Rhizopus oryzae TaxID=64495 RepID=A0A9P6XMD2_RHIOR|nr:hypothetical protein G6F51_014423 [Rhizopus arrhizus]